MEHSGIAQRLTDRKRWNKIYDSLNIADKIVIRWDDTTGEIHCGCCPAVVRNDNIEFHVKGKKHMDKLKVATENKLRQESMRTSIIKSNKMTRNIDENTHLFRAEFLRVLLECGIPYSKAAVYGPLNTFIENWTKMSVTDSSHLVRDYLHLIEKEQMEILLAEIKDREIRVGFDETTIVYSNMCFVVGFINASGKMIQRVVDLKQVKGNRLHVCIQISLLSHE